MTFLDLFCGCGGFSLGMERAGFRCLAAVDLNSEAVKTFRANFPEVPQVLERDLTAFAPEELARLIGTDRVDVITGGPPCQGFSGARKVDGSNHGGRLKEDSRRLLFREYLRYVKHFQPRVFVMENVLGLQTAAGGEYFTRVQHEARQLGYRVVAQVADAFLLGVPQKRRRQLIVGVRVDLPGFFPAVLAPAPRSFPGTTFGPAVGDLPPVNAGNGEEESKYDLDLRRTHLARWGKVARRYLYRVLEVARSPKLTAHRARPHSDRDLRDFALLNEGENSAQAMRRGVVFEWPYCKDHFKDRYTRQSRRKACSTIVAHLSKDGLMFVHPTQVRSITVREAARIQSFPDWFCFPVARTHQFRLIGNAVPPLVGEAVGLEVRSFLNQNVANKSRVKPQVSTGNPVEQLIPSTASEASAWLRKLAGLDGKRIRGCSRDEFLRGWYAFFYLFPNLHPDNARDHDEPISLWPSRHFSSLALQDMVKYRFERSGWPVAFTGLGREALRRRETGHLDSGEFYCVQAQIKGMTNQKADGLIEAGKNASNSVG